MGRLSSPPPDEGSCGTEGRCWGRTAGEIDESGVRDEVGGERLVGNVGKKR